jgi:hypothetical protein
VSQGVSQAEEGEQLFGDGTFRASLEVVVRPCSFFFSVVTHHTRDGRYQIILERQSPLHRQSLQHSIWQLEALLGHDERGVTITWLTI